MTRVHSVTTASVPLVPTQAGEPSEAKADSAFAFDPKWVDMDAAFKNVRAKLLCTQLGGMTNLAFVDVPATNTQAWLFWDPSQKQARTELSLAGCSSQ
jgi:hypothetical protein